VIWTETLLATSSYAPIGNPLLQDGQLKSCEYATSERLGLWSHYCILHLRDLVRLLPPFVKSMDRSKDNSRRLVDGRCMGMRFVTVMLLLQCGLMLGIDHNFWIVSLDMLWRYSRTRQA